MISGSPVLGFLTKYISGSLKAGPPTSSPKSFCGGEQVKRSHTGTKLFALPHLNGQGHPHCNLQFLHARAGRSTMPSFLRLRLRSWQQTILRQSASLLFPFHFSSSALPSRHSKYLLHPSSVPLSEKMPPHPDLGCPPQTIPASSRG